MMIQIICIDACRANLKVSSSLIYLFLGLVLVPGFVRMPLLVFCTYAQLDAGVHEPLLMSAAWYGV